MTGGLSSAAAMWTAIAAVVVSVVGGIFGWRNSGRATISTDQRAWLTTALDEARKAKREATDAEEHARKATVAANSATDRAEQAERRLNAVVAQADELAGWIGRVVRAANDIDLQNVSDPQVLRLLGVINGGPPSLSNSQLHRERNP